MMTERSTEMMIERSTEMMTERSTEMMTERSIDRSTHRRTNSNTDWSTEHSTDCSIEHSTDCSTEYSTDWYTDRSTDYSGSAATQLIPMHPSQPFLQVRPSRGRFTTGCPPLLPSTSTTWDPSRASCRRSQSTRSAAGQVTKRPTGGRATAAQVRALL